ELLVPILEHLAEARVRPETITVLGSHPFGADDLGDKLPEQFHRVRFLVHAPDDRKQLSYLATTKTGRRLYLNRAAVDADQVVVLSGRGYDPRLGYSGAEGSLFPALGDEQTLAETNGLLSAAIPHDPPKGLGKEAGEAAWLLGAPFFVQVIPAKGDDAAMVLAGPADSCAEGRRQLDARWRRIVAKPAATVVATISGDPARQGFAELAAAAFGASRVVQAGGRIVVLSAVTPKLGPAEELLRHADSAEHALKLLNQQKPPDMAAAFQWATAACYARLYLLSGLEADVAEELFAVPLDDFKQVERMLNEEGSCLVLDDAHKMLAVLE
ncbi:MAG TPA: lactate racemase domain-containing protein, partial [Gemmataceae bacterium]|nr:lactate racemase domain-containing protein [Gemmataceae bacterium]